MNHFETDVWLHWLPRMVPVISRCRFHMFSLIFTLQSKIDVIAQELNYDLLSVDGSAYSGNAGPFVK